MRVIKIFFIVFILMPAIAFSQFSNRSRWKRKIRYRNDFIIGLGTTNFLGDLGGANQIGTHMLRDLDGPAFRPALQVGLRYRHHPHFCSKAALYIGTLKGADKYTQEEFRNNRNLSFKSPIAEISIQGELYLLKEKYGRRYRIKGLKGMKNLDVQFYGFAGISAFMFNPKAKHKNGKWYELQPLGTEGQGILEGKEKYKRYGIAIPAGVGFKYGMGRFWSFGVEVGFRKTFTDYIDDVSTVYATDTVLAVNGPIAGYFADPSQQQGQYPFSVTSGMTRGNPEKNDSYVFITLTMNYKFTITRKRTRSKF